MSHQELLAEVEQVLQERHQEITLAVFRFMLNKHNPSNAKGCKCDYCALLPEYIRAKKYHHRIKSIVERDWYGVGIYDYSSVEYAKDEVRRLKKQKDQLKLI